MFSVSPNSMSHALEYSEAGALPECIALFVPSFRGGGAERAMMLFAEGLIDRGYRVDFLVVQNEGPLKHSLPQGVRLVDFGKRKVSFALPALIRYLRREQPVALYSTIVNANIIALCAARLAFVSCPVVIRESNLPNPDHLPTLARRISGRLAPLFYRFADSIISVSSDVADALSAVSPHLKGKIHVLPNPVVSERIFTLAEALPLHEWFVNSAEGESVPVVLSIGRLHPQKDFANLIMAFAEMRKSKNVRLLILGEGTERKALEALVAKLALTNDVSLPGYVENPFPYLKRSQLFVSSSRYEGMPNALLQAMAFGVPIVATDCAGGAHEVLPQHEHGELVPVGDSHAMAQAMTKLIDRPKSLKAAQFVVEQFSVERATRDYLRAGGLTT